MSRMALVAALSSVAAMTPQVVAADNPSRQVSAPEVVARCTEALGGADRWAEFRTLRFTFTGPGGTPIDWEIRRPNRLRQERDGEFVLVFDGARAGFLRGPRGEDGTLQGPHPVAAEIWHHFEMDLALYVPAFLDHPATHEGRREVDGSLVHLLHVALPMGGEVVYGIDAETYLPRWVTFPGFDVTYLLGEFEKVDGLLFPTRLWTEVDPARVSVIGGLEVNVDLPGSRFTLPAEAAVRVENAAAQRITTHTAWDYHPVFSPDGQTVLFTSQRGGTTGLWTVPAGGGTATRIPLPRTGDLYADWAPDGESIVADFREGQGPGDIYRYFLHDGSLARLTDHPGPDAHPAFSPGGTQIVFTSLREGREDIWVMDADGTRARAITRDDYSDWHPRWSPDGTQVAFTSDRSGSDDIWIIDIDGTGLRRVTDRPGQEDRSSWSPDGALILFQTEGDLWVVSADGGTPVQVTRGTGREGHGAWSPDGTRIAYVSHEGENMDIYVISPDPDLLEVARRGGG